MATKVTGLSEVERSNDVVVYRLESRFKKRRWLPNWLPGNVYARVFMGESTWDEIKDTVEVSVAGGAFSVLVEAADGFMVGVGGVHVEECR